MIIEDYCSYETAMLLKEKGFNAELKMYWNKGYNNEPILNSCPCPFDEDEPDGINLIEIDNSGKSCDSNHWWHPKEFDCIAPTHQMAMKWLREVHNIHVEVDVQEDNTYMAYCYMRKGTHWRDQMPPHKPFPSYEESVEAALKYSLEKLI